MMNFRQCQRSYHLGKFAYGRLASAHSLRLIGRNNDPFRIVTSVRYAATDRSKVENTLKMLKEDLQKQQEDEAKQLKLVPINKDVVKKLTIKEKVVHELKHYYHGFRLLALETRLSAKYVWRLARGAVLSRRERQQLVRTVSDLFRLVPFSIFIIVPFMELALPIFIKLFPNMLPSTFQERSKEDEKMRKQVKVKVEMAKFLQDTIEEIALERKSKARASKDSKALEFARFIKKVRSEGGYVSNEELFKFSKLFEDELTLDNLSMSQLRSLCRLMIIQPLGSPEILRFQLNMKLRELKADDKQIAAEGGVDALNTIDLQQACRVRGMRSVGLSEERLRDQLKQWLELSLNDKVPPSLLLLSRALYLPEDITFADRLKALVQSLPEGIAEQTRQKLTEMEGGKVDHKARIALIKQIEDGIVKETALAAEKLRLEEQQKELQRVAEEAKAKLESEEAATPEHLVHAASTAHASVEAVKEEISVLAQELETTKKVTEQLQEKEKSEAKIDPTDLESIEQIIVGGPIHEAKHDIIGLKEKVIEHTEDLIEVNSLDEAFSESKVAKKLRSKLNTMIEQVDTLVSKLEEEKRNVDETIADPTLPESSHVKMERQVKIQDLVDSLTRLQSGLQDGKKERIEELLNTLDSDRDGILDADLVLQVIALTEKHSGVSLSANEMTALVDLLRKEDEIETAARAMKDAHFDAPIQPQVPQIENSVEEESATVDLPDVDRKVTATLQKKNGVEGAAKKVEKM